MTSWMIELFGVEKPIIGMAHVPALPGAPRYDQYGGIDYLIQTVREDLQYLEEGGVNAIMFCNEDDRPYTFKAGIEQIAAMTRVITETRPRNIPIGVDFLWDPLAAIAIAHAVGASFIREVLTGTYESDMGLWSPNAGEVLRFRRNIGADNIRLFYNVSPEFASSLGNRSVVKCAQSAVVSCLADAILVSGSMAGEEPDIATCRDIKEALGDVPVILNTGAKHDNIAEFLKVVDGAIVGTSFKFDGSTWNRVDPRRVKSFMRLVEKSKSGLGK
jgi:membrane complex biogenesis BtpA family protein